MLIENEKNKNLNILNNRNKSLKWGLNSRFQSDPERSDPERSPKDLIFHHDPISKPFHTVLRILKWGEFGN